MGELIPEFFEKVLDLPVQSNPSAHSPNRVVLMSVFGVVAECRH
jgi:hypothetical protein